MHEINAMVGPREGLDARDIYIYIYVCVCVCVCVCVMVDPRGGLDARNILLLLLLLLTASGYVPGGSGTIVHKTTHTHSKQYTTQ
jgi:hypothetical protein